MSEIKDKNYADVQGSGRGLKIIEDKKMSKGMQDCLLIFTIL